MDELIKKISTYNIFNNILPGAVFVLFSSRMGMIKMEFNNMVIELFVYYFVGLVISRIGSIIIEPFLKWIRLVKFIEYKQYIAATKNDTNIELLSEINNMYRSILATIICIFIFKVYIVIIEYNLILKSYSKEIVLVCVFILFLVSYRKQTAYITNRVESQQKSIING
jgi:hypothetical protein